MANQIETILQRDINSVSDLKKAIKELTDSLVGLDTSSEEYRETSEKLVAAQDALKNTTRAGIEANNAAKDSLVGLKAEYKALYDQYKMLTEEQRNSDFGKNMASSLETLSNKINDTQKGVGAFKDNIGRYAQDVTNAFNGMGVSVGALKGPLDAATKGTKGLNTAFTALSKHPILLALTAIVAILAKAAAAIKNNEELMNRLKVAMSVFKPVLDAVANAFDFLAGIIVKVVEGLSRVAEKIMSVIPGMRAAIQSHKELAKATNELTQRQREAEKVNSKKQAEIERLREEASATQDVTEKRKLLEEAKAIQAEVDQENIAIAQEELRILQEYGEKTANSAEENEKLAAAQKKVNDAVAQGERNQRMYNKQLDATTKKTGGATSAAKNYREEAKKIYEESVEDSKDEVTKLTEKYEKEKKLLEKYHFDTKLLTQKYNKELAAIEKTNQEKAREEIRASLSQRKNDLNNYWDILRRSGKESLADALEAEYIERKIIPEVEKIYGEVIGIIKNLFKQSEETAKDFRDKAFLNLGDEYEDLKNKVKDLNAKYGLSITTIDNLQNSYFGLSETLKQLNGEYSNSVINEKKSEEYAKYLDELIKRVTGSDSGYTEYVKEVNRKLLEVEKEEIEKQLKYFEGTDAQRIELKKRLYEILAELRQKDYEDELEKQEKLQALQNLQKERTEQMVENLIDMTDRIGSSLSTIRSSYETLIDSQLRAGQIDESEANKRKKRLLNLQKAETAFNIATIVADAASGIFSVWKGYATETGVINPQTAAAAGPGAALSLAALNTKSLVSAIAKTTSLASTATAQIMAARNGIVSAKNNFKAESGSESVGVAATPMLIESTPYSYTRTLQTAEEQDEINQRPIWVSVVDVENALGQQVQVRNESSF